MICTHLLACPQGVPHLTQQGVVVPGGGRGAEDAAAPLGGVGVDIVEATWDLDLQEGVESVLATVKDLRLDLESFTAAHQIGIQPKQE
jgi:hypothetical protein